VAYFFMEVVVETRRLSRLELTHIEAFKIWNEKAEAADLDLLVLPDMPVYWSVGSSTRTDMTTPEEDVEDKLRSFLIVLMLMIPVVFEIHAYSILLRISLTSIVVWANLLVTITLLGAIVWLLGAPAELAPLSEDQSTAG
jgi:hypothetical protein